MNVTFQAQLLSYTLEAYLSNACITLKSKYYSHDVKSILCKSHTIKTYRKCV